MVEREEDDTSVEASLDELLQKKAADRPVDVDEEDDILDLDLRPDEEQVLDPLSVKPVPPQPNEFTCRSCFLVKHQSQRASPDSSICNDCA